MGMFDWYEPDPALSCPDCGTPLREWQGKEGENALFVWKQGKSSPVDQRVDEELKLPPEQLLSRCLPAEFEFYSYDCPRHRIIAQGKTRGGVWTESKILHVGVLQRPSDRPQQDR